MNSPKKQHKQSPKSSPLRPQSLYLLAKVKHPVTAKASTTQPFQQFKQKDFSLIESLPDGFVILSVDAHIMYANPVAARILRRSKTPSGVNTFFIKLLGRSSRQKFIQILSRVRKGETILEELNVLGPHNEIQPIDVVVSLVKPKSPQNGFQVILRDITEKKKKEEAFSQNEKMQVVQNFVTGTAQKIYHPLKVLLDRSQHLINKYKTREFEYLSFNDFQNILDSLELIADQIKYCYETSSQVMKLTKKRVGSHEICHEFNQTIRQIIHAHKHETEGANINVTFRESRNIPAVAINQIDLEQVIQNVITNAIQSMPGGGKVSIKTALASSGREVVFECQDSGVGIPREMLPHLFEPFFAIKHRPRSGHRNSGLGLSIVYSIIQSHRGRIDIKSDQRKGTTVTIFLPVAKISK